MLGIIISGIVGIAIGIVGSYFYVRNNKKRVEKILKAEKNLGKI